MTILQLKYVIAIASSTSIREATEKLFVSQPALSSTIRELEEEESNYSKEITKGFFLQNMEVNF